MNDMSHLTLKVYTKSDCPWCERAKEWLDVQHVPYITVVLDDVAARNEFYDELGLLNGNRTMPQIVVEFLDGEQIHIGNYEALTTSRVETLFITAH